MGTEVALIFGSAPCENWTFLEPYRGRAYVICADGGTRRAAEAGFPVDLYIGDSDSGGSPPAGVEAVLLRPEKNLTDLQAAYEAARDRGYGRMVFTACTGGRQDHHLANLQLLETAHHDNVDAVILDAQNEIRYCCGGTWTVAPGGFRYFSILPLDRELHGVRIVHAKYPLDAAVVRRGDSLTVSNETLDGPAVVTIDSGAAWLIRSDRLADDK